MRISSTNMNPVPGRMAMSRSIKWHLTTVILMTAFTVMFLTITTIAAAATEKSSMSTTAMSTPTMPSMPHQVEENTTSQIESSNDSIGDDDGIPKHRIGEIESSIGFYQAIELVQNSLLYSKQSKYQTYVFTRTPLCMCLWLCL